MRIDQEPKIGVVVPDGKHIKPVVMELLGSRGYEYGLWTNGRLHADVDGLPMSLTFQNHPDVIKQVSQGVFAAGFVGSDRLSEHKAFLAKSNILSQVIEVGRFRLFPFSLRLSTLVRDNPYDNREYRTPEDLRGKRVVTNYPLLTEQFLRQFFPGAEILPVEIDEVTGKEEGQVDAGVAGAAVVVVDSGDTMRKHMLRELNAGVVMRRIYVAAIANIDFLGDEDNRERLKIAFDRLQNGPRARTGFSMRNLAAFSQTFGYQQHPLSLQ